MGWWAMNQKSGYGTDWLIRLIDGDAEECKWYTWENDMTALSERFPDVRFDLSGEGEESGDIWECTLLGGKKHLRKAEVMIPPFDPEKLK